MAAFFDFSKNHKHHGWGVFVTSVTDEFGDTLIKSFVLDLLDPTLANFHSSKCTLLRIFDWLVIELSVAKPVVKYWQRHIWTNSTAKLGVLLSSVVTQHIIKAFVPNEGKPSTVTTFNLLAFNITWKWQYNAHKCHAYFEGYGKENGRSWAHVYLKTYLFTPEKLCSTKKKKLRSGAILRSGGDAKQVYFFIWPNIYKNRYPHLQSSITQHKLELHCTCH